MKTTLVLLGAVATRLLAPAATLPYISTHPQSIVVPPGSNANFTVVSTNATAYQWRFNGVDIAWGTASSLVITNAQSTNVGYHMAVVQNAIGWTPSQLAYLSVVTPGQGGTVPFSNLGNSNSPAGYQCPNFSDFGGPPITNATAQLLAGPQLDQMFPTGSPRPVNNGFFSSSGRRVPNVAPNERIWFRVEVTYLCNGGTFTQQSTTLSQIAGNEGYSSTAPNAFAFPTWIEWPEPRVHDFYCFPGEGYPLATNQFLVPGESPRIAQQCPVASASSVRMQWRKDGVAILGATNRSLTFSNFQPGNVGVYDFQAFAMGDAGAANSKKFYLGIQVTNGEGRFRLPRRNGTYFICDFEGVPERRYSLLWSTNLTDWSNLLTLVTTNGNASFRNAVDGNTKSYYRAMILP